MDNIMIDENNFPIRGNLKWIYIGTFIITALMTIVSVAGIFLSSTLYPTEELLKSFYSNDVINILVGVPILLGSMWATKREKLLGLLFWPGSLFFMIYNYIIYSFSMPFNFIYLIYPLLVILSILSTIGLVSKFDKSVILQTLYGKVPERFGGGVLMFFGLAFAGRAISLIISQEDMQITELALNISDIILSIIWIMVGLWLWRKKEIGYSLGLGLLFQGSMLFIGLIVLMLLQPKLIGSPIIFGEIIQIIIMGMIFFIPFILFIRGVLKANK